MSVLQKKLCSHKIAYNWPIGQSIGPTGLCCLCSPEQYYLTAVLPNLSITGEGDVFQRLKF